jgi:hypothetical protein
MPHSEAQAWWAEVQHVLESIERRRAGGADSSAPLDAPSERRFVRAAADSPPPGDDVDWTSALPDRTGGRFIHTDTPQRTAPAGRTRRLDDRTRRPDDRTRRPDDRTRRPEDSTRRSDGRTRRPDDRRADEHIDVDAELAALQTERQPRSAPERPRGTGANARANATAPGAAVAIEPPPARRTVQITGRPGNAPSRPRLVEIERRRPPRRPAERVGPRPDRIALWAVLLGFFLILVAATSSNAATHPAHSADQAAVALHAPAR